MSAFIVRVILLRCLILVISFYSEVLTLCFHKFSSFGRKITFRTLLWNALLRFVTEVATMIPMLKCIFSRGLDMLVTLPFFVSSKQTILSWVQNIYANVRFQAAFYDYSPFLFPISIFPQR